MLLERVEVKVHVTRVCGSVLECVETIAWSFRGAKKQSGIPVQLTSTVAGRSPHLHHETPAKRQRGTANRFTLVATL